MNTFAPYKVVSALPSPLVANAVYAVRVGTGFDLYIVDSSGANAFKVNGGDSSMSYLTTIYGDSEAYAFVLNTQGLTTAQLDAWLNNLTRINQFATLLNSRVTLFSILNDSALMTAVAASQTAMAAVAASQTAMTAVAASSTAMTVVIASQTAMTAVAASQTAMTAVAASSTAMTVVIASQTAMTAVAASSTAMTAVENNATAYNILHTSASGMAIVAVSATAMGVIAASATYLANLFTSQVARRSLVTGITDWGTNAALDAIRNSTTAMTWLRANKVAQFDLANNDAVQNVYNGKAIAVEYWSNGNYGDQGVPSGFYVNGVAKQTRNNSDSTPDVAVKGSVGQLQCKDGYYFTSCKYIILD